MVREHFTSDGAGGAIIGWIDYRNYFTSASDLYAQRVTHDGTIAPGWPVDGAPICTAPRDQLLPSIVPDGSGGALLVWKDARSDTSGDIYVFFRHSNVLAVGDVASPARDPELDYFTGAWIGGRVDAMDRLLKLSDDKTRIVPGFGPVMSRAELKAERDMMSAVYDRTVDRVREGDSAEDMLKAGVMNGLTRTFKDPRRFLYDVHKGLWAHHNKLAPNVV